MEITIQVPDELAARVRAEGMPLEKYVENLLALQVENVNLAQPPDTPRIHEWLDSLAQFSERIPPLPEILSREWIYQEHP